VPSQDQQKSQLISKQQFDEVIYISSDDDDEESNSSSVELDTQVEIPKTPIQPEKVKEENA
jgi:hypothetical protein